MLELTLSIFAVLIRFKDLNAVSNSSVVKSKLLMGSLDNIHSVQSAETGEIFLQGPTFLKKELNSFTTCYEE